MTLQRCLAAIKAAQEPPEELIVIVEPSGIGPAAARNLGAERATGDVLVFVDSDVEVHRDAFRRIRRAFEADGELAALFGSYDDDPERNGLVSDFRNLLHHHVHQTGAGPATTFWAGLGAVRREDFLSVGGFDERRFPRASVEDIDLGMRLSRKGKSIVLDPVLQGKHLKRWSLSSMIRTDLLRRGVPWVRLLLENDASSGALNLSWRNRASAAASLTLLVALAARRPRPAGAACMLLLGLNSSFYLLLLSRRGIRQAATGIPLHVLHHIVSVVAVPIGVLDHLYARERGHSAS
jgi:GT2 family glycosyltransferase